jgi:hypothetical protein
MKAIFNVIMLKNNKINMLFRIKLKIMIKYLKLNYMINKKKPIYIKIKIKTRLKY